MTMSGSDVARRMRGGRSEGTGDGALTSSTLSICDTATTARASWSASSGLKPGAGVGTSMIGNTLRGARTVDSRLDVTGPLTAPGVPPTGGVRSEEHTSELQSRLHLVCRLLLEKKKNQKCARVIREMQTHKTRQPNAY